jgi:DNA mismatch repair protein MutS
MALSPMMQQYINLKEQYTDSLLFFRLGDFYEMFFEDAKLASKELELTLTGRDCGLSERAPMCGVPYHAMDHYVQKLLEKGYKVAICEQLSEPTKGKSIVERDVVRIITPGTVIEESLLDEKVNNYICAIYKSGDNAGISYCDVSTGEFSSVTLNGGIYTKLVDEIVRLKPSEVLVNNEMFLFLNENSDLLKLLGVKPYLSSEESFDYSQSKKRLSDKFENTEENEMLVCSAGALLDYLQETQKNALEHINTLRNVSHDNFVRIDAATSRNLEITSTMRGGSRRGSLLWLLDKTVTSMGARRLKKWMDEPLYSMSEINLRLDAVEDIKGKPILHQQTIDEMKKIYDIERISTKIAYDTLNPRDCVSLRQSLEVLPFTIEKLSSFESELMSRITSEFDDLSDICELLKKSISDDPPINVKDGDTIRDGYFEELDDLRDISRNAKKHLEKMEIAEREQTGIKNLKIKYNRVFGYFIEVTKSYIDQVPYRYIRKQTLANSERYITEELGVLEERIAGAEEKSIKLEGQLFTEIKSALKSNMKRLQKAAELISEVDMLQSFAKSATENNYVKPAINDEGVINIKEGRHPVVEKSQEGKNFVPNNTHLNMDDNRFMIITGANMAGKSTFIRQVALITLMAHIGCFVPAHSAEICLVDKIFSRVGASDDLFMGQSTFMVEMSELANILNNATSRSLIILDEIGRGTSTFDGLSVAWSVVEYICDKSKLGAKTLFATHYHQLSEFEGRVAGVKNYCVSVREQGEDIIFLRRIVRGGADKSFGIHVAKLAGVPKEVLDRANVILKRLEEADINNVAITSSHEAGKMINEKENYTQTQLELTDMLPYSNILDEIKQMDMTTTTPIDAFYILDRLKDKMK